MEGAKRVIEEQRRRYPDISSTKMVCFRSGIIKGDINTRTARRLCIWRKIIKTLIGRSTVADVGSPILYTAYNNWRKSNFNRHPSKIAPGAHRHDYLRRSVSEHGRWGLPATFDRQRLRSDTSSDSTKWEDIISTKDRGTRTRQTRLCIPA